MRSDTAEDTDEQHHLCQQQQEQQVLEEGKLLRGHNDGGVDGHQRQQRHCTNRKIVLLSGLSGSGKTTMGERMKKWSKDDGCFSWIHFDGDAWMSGCSDPVEESGQVNMDPSKTRPDIKAVVERARKEGYQNVLEEFYDLMCLDIAKVYRNPKYSYKNILLTHSVYRASTRSFVKRRLEELLSCNDDKDHDKSCCPPPTAAVQVVVIRCSDESLVDRRTERAKKRATEAGSSSFEEYLSTAMKNGFDISEPTESAFRNYVQKWNNAFEDATNSEDILDVTDGKDVDAMFEALCVIVEDVAVIDDSRS